MSIVYVNGDSHSAGAGIINGYCFADEDPRYLAYGRRAHPEAIPHTYGYKISKTLNQGIFLEAESASSNDRILRTTKNFLEQTKDKSKIFLLIGWTSFEREEWKHGEDWIQVTASGTDSVPEEFKEKYKDWVTTQTSKTLLEKSHEWHDKIYQFHKYLENLKIGHLFFNTYTSFDSTKQYNWNEKYYKPYEETFHDFLIKNNYKKIDGQHFGGDGHTAWSKNITESVVTQMSWFDKKDFPKNQLTEIKKQSIITKAKTKPFTGLIR